MKIFVIHYDKLVERKKCIINQMKKFNLDFEFVSNHGKENISLEEKKKFRRITDAEISLMLHHIECLKQISLENDNEYALILEDDVLLNKDFNKLLEIYIKQLPADWDMLFIGNGCNLHIPQELLTNNQFIYKKDVYQGASRCADSYLITKKCAKFIFEKFQQPNYMVLTPYDIWLNNVMRHNKLNIYWSEPTIVEQGSENGIYKSSLR